LTSTPKATNGASTPKSAKDSTAKAAKPKAKKATPKATEIPEAVAAPKEPELTPEEKRAKKEVRLLCRILKTLSDNLLERNTLPST
jgi:hypothetical protein